MAWFISVLSSNTNCWSVRCWTAGGLLDGSRTLACNLHRVAKTIFLHNNPVWV